MTQTPAPMTCTRRRNRELSRPIAQSIVRAVPANLSLSRGPYDRPVSSQLESLQRVTDAALAYLSEDELLAALLDRITEILRSDTAAILMLEPDGKMLLARAAKGIEEEVEQGVAHPGRPRLRRPHRGRARADLHPRRRPRRHPQPDPAREGHPLPARRPAARRGPADRRAARRQPDPARVHGRRPGAAAARRRPRRAGHRPRAPVRAGAQRPPARWRRSSASPTPRSPICPRTSCWPSCSSASPPR